jgi:hypothetical protein
MAKGLGGETWAALQRRVVSDLEGAVRRKTPGEARLSGAIRVLAPLSPSIRAALVSVAGKLTKRGNFDRELYATSVRSLAECGDKRVVTVLRDALAAEEAGGLSTLSAACFVQDAALSEPLTRAASSQKAHVSFAAEVARMARGEETSAHLTALAPKIKESHRIALCIDLFLPLTRGVRLSAGVAPALSVLRGAERHLGRWLLLAEVASLAGDGQPAEEALERSRVGPSSSRSAWSLVAWALAPERVPEPTTRPTAELVARLSDRPSADRDTTFLFRLGSARVPTARTMLEGFVRQKPLPDEVAVRAAGCLVRGYGRDDLREPLQQIACAHKRDDLRGVASAALWDSGDHDVAVRAASELMQSKTLGAQTWAALVLHEGQKLSASQPPNGDVLDEARFRRLQWGWLE